MQRSDEQLSHFHCEACGKWFAIGDPEYRSAWYCPWCGDFSAVTGPPPAVPPRPIRPDVEPMSGGCDP